MAPAVAAPAPGGPVVATARPPLLALDCPVSPPPPFRPVPASPRDTSISHLPDGPLHRILDCLGPRDLIAATATCRAWAALGADAASDHAWEVGEMRGSDGGRRVKEEQLHRPLSRSQAFYLRRWRALDTPTAPRWRVAYARRLAHAATLTPGQPRPAVDALVGHRGAARSVALLPAADAALTASADRTVRLWCLSSGAQAGASAPLPGGARCVAGDAGAVCGALAAAGTGDGSIAVWTAASGALDPTSRPALLTGHGGPVAGVSVDAATIASASWDCTARLWSRPSLACVAVLPLVDWGWGAVVRGGRALVAEGRGAAAFDAATGALLRRLPPRPAPPGACLGHGARVDGTRDGRTLFVAGADGGVDAVDLRSPSPSSLALARPGGPPPSSLAHDDPWLALATGSGGVTLLDARAPRRAPRRLGAGLAGRPACARSVDIQGRWVAAAFDDSAGVRVWRFGREEEEQRGRGA